jgi:hypothetical protein
VKEGIAGFAGVLAVLFGMALHWVGGGGDDWQPKPKSATRVKRPFFIAPPISGSVYCLSFYWNQCSQGGKLYFR